jgi:hypothetical protein
MTKASNRKRNFYRQQWRRDAAATIQAADPATIEAALAHSNTLANAGIPASSTEPPAQKTNANNDCKRLLAQEIRMMHRADCSHPSDETNENGKRNRNEGDDESQRPHRLPGGEGSPSETVSTSLSTISAGSDAGEFGEEVEAAFRPSSGRNTERAMQAKEADELKQWKDELKQWKDELERMADELKHLNDELWQLVSDSTFYDGKSMMEAVVKSE